MSQGTAPQYPDAPPPYSAEYNHYNPAGQPVYPPPQGVYPPPQGNYPHPYSTQPQGYGQYPQQPGYPYSYGQPVVTAQTQVVQQPQHSRDKNRDNECLLIGLLACLCCCCLMD
ncbi:cysteine-rich and transmembrane domain-containing protein 1-like [Dreissena polymorpha]|uniref:Cysteine-rich and transmembrane domain-containing protein 1 n=1 Tax=Dreissena polymorpha TaxID=45954 RepID=A0A9D4CB14_DREPO|nr:cysteine-rich and transmembrane domain-containing protein 1-like [Dreissena polymorpha]XP_052248422.1 cysteine-rich and transmembrane domain-containing protein 1-like [Dreissena polymorpha]XP_052248423.1 cysteine-rich and transmembrane domain-containing protein 1-like [Dreissena polymorpha]XP_052248424.1 cysteine-rich and transmembrane domain-containing protein 1-like [Dreissena polymorpha]KAH3720412.1 hypothetical protein DPMN_063311 [Dreissena polymorpha]